MKLKLRGRLTWLVLFGAAITLTALYQAKKVAATPANGFAGTTLAKGTFGEIDVFNSFIPPKVNDAEGQKRDIWLSWQKTKGSSDLYVQSNVWQPGGNTGWHTHPGHSLIIVTAGAVTAYEGDDPDCKPHVFTPGGSGFVDADHVHIVRNEGTVEARAIVVQLVPAGAMRRIDAEDPGNCSF